MACLREPCPSAWILNQSGFVWDPVHLWVAIGRKKLTHPSPRLPIWRDISKINSFFTLFSHLPYLCSIKEPGIQTPIGWLFWAISLPSWSADFKVVFLLLAKILAFSAHQSQIKIMETEFGGNRKVALILSWWSGEHSKLMPQELCSCSWEI